MTTAVEAHSGRGKASTSPAEAFTRVTSSAVEYVSHKLSDAAEGLAGKGMDVVADEISDGSATQQAGMAGVAAAVQGGNPVWAVIKSVWSGAGVLVKAAVVAGVVAMVLLLLLSPVLLLAFLLSLLIIAAIEKVRSTQR